MAAPSGSKGESEAKKKYCYFDSKEMMINFWILAIFWSTSIVNFYAINYYMPYVPGDVYLNTFYSSLSENVSNLVSGFIYGILGVNPSFFIGYVLSALGGLLIMGGPTGHLMGCCVILAKFAITYVFNIAYMSTPDFFPKNMTTTVMGYLNIMARVCTTLAPLIAVQPAPVPMIVFVTLSAVPILFVKMLSKSKVK